MRRDTGSSSSTSPTFPCKRYEKCSCATQHRREQPKPRSSRLPGGVGGGGLGYGLAGQVHRCLDFAALSRGAAAEIRPAGGLDDMPGTCKRAARRARRHSAAAFAGLPVCFGGRGSGRGQPALAVRETPAGGPAPGVAQWRRDRHGARDGVGRPSTARLLRRRL